MSAYVDSAEAPPSAAVEYTRHLIRRRWGWSSRTWGDWDDGQWGRGSIADLGAARLVDARAGLARVSARTPKLIRERESDAYKLELLLGAVHRRPRWPRGRSPADGEHCGDQGAVVEYEDAGQGGAGE
jgi:hypothetical protein